MSPKKLRLKDLQVTSFVTKVRRNGAGHARGGVVLNPTIIGCPTHETCVITFCGVTCNVSCNAPCFPTFDLACL